jgi:Superinfection immunity protein
MVSALLTIIVVGLLTAGSAVLYLLPVIVGVARRVPDIGAVAVVNIALGWTLVGWVAALAMATRSAPPPAAPAVQVFQSFSPPARGPDAGWAPRPGVPPPLALPPRPGEPGDTAERQ